TRGRVWRRGQKKNDTRLGLTARGSPDGPERPHDASNARNAIRATVNDMHRAGNRIGMVVMTVGFMVDTGAAPHQTNELLGQRRQVEQLNLARVQCRFESFV